MLQEQQKIVELLDGFDNEMKRRGLTINSRLYNLRCITPLVRFHEERGAEWLDGSIIAEYMRIASERYDNGNARMKYFAGVRRNIEQFVVYAMGGNPVWNNPHKGSTYVLTPVFQQIADGYLECSQLHPNTRNDARWVTHKYFAWLAEHGYENLYSVGAGQLQKFLVFCAENMMSNSLYNVKLHFKKLYAYLYESGQSVSEFKEFLSFKVNRTVKIFRPMPKEDLARVIGSIDRTTISGKREYATMMLGAVLGLRACDVVLLKLTDIDWVNGEIKLIQSKTENSLTLPLTNDVGEALRDYILHGRRNTGDSSIFQCLKSPYGALSGHVLKQFDPNSSASIIIETIILCISRAFE
jgi:hypothetical protein